MLSRVANSVYWMARYLERANNVARYLDVHATLLLDMGIELQDAQWGALVAASGDDDAFFKRYPLYTEKNVVRFLTFDEQNSNSMLVCIERARENARTVRDVIPPDVWEEINELYHLLQKYKRRKRIDNLKVVYERVRKGHDLIAGMLANTMSRGQAWHFLMLGTFLERADKTARLLDVKYFLLLPKAEDVDSPQDSVEWGAVLTSVNGLDMYRKTYHRINFRNVAEFLLFDPLFPRSVAYCVARAEGSLNGLSHLLGDAHMADLRSSLEVLHTMTHEQNIAQVIATGLHEYVDLFQIQLNRVDDEIFSRFFAFRDMQSFVKAG